MGSWLQCDLSSKPIFYPLELMEYQSKSQGWKLHSVLLKFKKGSMSIVYVDRWCIVLKVQMNLHWRPPLNKNADFCIWFTKNSLLFLHFWNTVKCLAYRRVHFCNFSLAHSVIFSFKKCFDRSSKFGV